MATPKREIQRGGDDPAKSAWIDELLRRRAAQKVSWPYPKRKRKAAEKEKPCATASS